MKRRIDVLITEEQHKKLQNESKKLGSSMGSIIRHALEEYFSKKEVIQ